MLEVSPPSESFLADGENTNFLSRYFEALLSSDSSLKDFSCSWGKQSEMYQAMLWVQKMVTFFREACTDVATATSAEFVTFSITRSGRGGIEPSRETEAIQELLQIRRGRGLVSLAFEGSVDGNTQLLADFYDALNQEDAILPDGTLNDECKTLLGRAGGSIKEIMLIQIQIKSASVQRGVGQGS